MAEECKEVVPPWSVVRQRPLKWGWEGEKIMWVYRTEYDASIGTAWVVGYYDPSKSWVRDSAWGSQAQAAERVHWLNGGESSPLTVKTDVQTKPRRSEG
jgi:hypothetical protein